MRQKLRLLQLSEVLPAPVAGLLTSDVATDLQRMRMAVEVSDCRNEGSGEKLRLVEHLITGKGLSRACHFGGCNRQDDGAKAGAGSFPLRCVRYSI